MRLHDISRSRPLPVRRSLVADELEIFQERRQAWLQLVFVLLMHMQPVKLG